MSAHIGVTQEQWQEAERLFLDGSDRDDTSLAMPQHKYDTIVHLLKNWDVLTPAEKREMSKGNYMYWKKKYTLSPADNAGGRELLYQVTLLRVAHEGNLFGCIKAIHTNSTHSTVLYTCP